MNAATIATERREADLAVVRQADPDAYLAEIKRDDACWMAELQALRPEAYAIEAAQRAEKAEAARLTACEGQEAGAYVMIQTDVRNGLRSHSADSRLIFEVVEEPKPGHVRLLLDFDGSTELLHLAESITAAELWIVREGYRSAWLKIVGAESGEWEGGADLAL